MGGGAQRKVVLTEPVRSTTLQRGHAPVTPSGNGASATDWSPRRNALIAEHISKSFAGLSALSDVDIEVQPGQIVGLIGGNGSVKRLYSTSLVVFTLRTRAVSELGKEGCGRLSVWVARAGIGRTFQTPHLPEEVTVLQAVVAAFHRRRRALSLSTC